MHRLARSDTAGANRRPTGGFSKPVTNMNEDPGSSSPRSETPTSDDDGGFSTDTSVEFELVVETEATESAEPFAGGWRTACSPMLAELWNVESPGRAGLVGVVLTGAQRIRELNGQFRGKDLPTDVLSFDLSDDVAYIEGEIYVGMDRATAQAEDIGCSLAEETARLMVHGMLHLAGHDHHSPDEERTMLEATERWVGRWRSLTEHES